MIFNKDVFNKKKILKELDSLGYTERVNKIAILGRKNIDSKQYLQLLYSLLEDGEYEANLALVGACAIKNSKVILSALDHPKATIRLKAAGLLVKVASDSEIEEVVSNLSYQCRRRLFKSISKEKRQNIAEKLLSVAYYDGRAKEASLLLPACSKETIKKYLPKIGYAIENWSKIANYYPDIMMEYFKEVLSKSTDIEKINTWWRFSSATEKLSLSNADFILECVINYGPSNIIFSVLGNCIGALMKRSPDKVYKILISNQCRKKLLSEGLPDAFLENYKYFSTEQWIEICKLISYNPSYLALVFEYFSPSIREEIFEAVYKDEERKEKIFPEILLSQLPNSIRDKEAKRMLALHSVSDNRDKYLSITSYTLIEDARETLEEAAKASKAEDRARALSLLIQSTNLSRSGIDKTLKFLCRIKNDQDSVKSAVFQGLFNCSPALFNDSNIKDLNLIIDSVIDARDASTMTLYAIQRFAIKIMKYNSVNIEGELFKFSIITLVKIAKKTDSIPFPSFQENLPDGVEKILFDAFYPLAVTGNRREDYRYTLKLAKALGKRGYKIEKLQSLLKETIMAKPDNVAMEAVSYWLAPKETRDERVKYLLSIDKSFITSYKVFTHLHRKRQQWLDPFINGDAIKGRFLTGKTIYLLPATNSFDRWLPRQQEAFSCILQRVIYDRSWSLKKRAEIIKIMAKIDDIDNDKLIKLLSNSEKSIVEAAIQGISLTAEPEKALPILLERLDGGYASVAMYSIPRCIRRVNPVLINSILENLLKKENLKITVRKEVVRLIGEYRNDNSILLLMNEFEKENLHKDVMIAIGHAARKFLDDERGWRILDFMATSYNIDIRESVLNQYSYELPEQHRKRYLKLIINIAKHKDGKLGEEAFYAMESWISGNEEIIAETAVSAIEDLEDTIRWNVASDILVNASREGTINKYIIDLFDYLANVKIRDEWNGSLQRDLPHRQRLFNLAEKLISLPFDARMKLLNLYQGIIDTLSSNKTLNTIVIKFYIASIDWNNEDLAIDYINNIVTCIKKQPSILKDVYNDISINLKDSKGYWNTETLISIVNKISDGSPSAQFIALSLLEVIGSSLGWRKDCVEFLCKFRNSDNIDITSKALDIWVTNE